jgi:hypothetical protein
MPVRLGADYWRERAEEARIHASQMRHPDAKRTLLHIAENYEQLAEQADRMRLSGVMPSDQH